MARPLLIALILAAPVVAQDNVLLVVLDDVGVDRVRSYGEHPSSAPTPNLDALADEGVLFRNCWATPFCSPTRASVLTGRHGFRTGIGNIITTMVGGTGLSLDEWILPEVLAAGSEDLYRTAAIGKWHLAGPADPPWNAMVAGFDLYAGAPHNLGVPGDEQVWWNFTKEIPGTTVQVNQYATTDEVDDALRAIEGFGDEPWFVYLALHAAHQPYHAPPGHLHDRPLSGDPDDTKALHHKAAVQALDSELGRLFASLPADTHVLVVGDNGTQGNAVEPPFVPQHGKGTLFEGGIRVPLIVAGPAVPPAAKGRVSEALVQTVDLFPTVTELCGLIAHDIVPSEVVIDGRSLVPLLADPDAPSGHPALYCELFKPNHADPADYTAHRRAARDGRYKLVRNELDGSDRLYDLQLDPFEHRDLLVHKPQLSDQERRAYLDLDRVIRSMRE